jgi:hypothetical protein
MNIEISEKEYRELLDILHIADVVMSGHRREEDRRSAPHRSLIQKLYSLALREGLENLIKYDELTHVHTPTAAFEENTLAHSVIDEFGDHLFWDELITRLSVRDAAQEAGGVDRLSALNESDRRAVEGPIRQRYLEEFSKNGAANVVVVARFDLGGGLPVKTSD